MNCSKKTSRKIILGLIGLAFVGVIVALMLVQHFYDIRNGTAAFDSFCNVHSKMNCDVIAASPHAELIAGLPIASFGAGWFLALFIISSLARRAEWFKTSLRFGLGMSGVGTLIGCFYFLIMATVLKTYCLLCLILDGVQLSYFLLSLWLSLIHTTWARSSPKLSAFKLHLRPASWNFKQISILSILSFSVLWGTVFGLHALERIELSPADLERLSQKVLNTPALVIPLDRAAPSLGPQGAPITIFEFSDFECPFCRMSALALNTVMNRYPGKIQVLFKNYPLNTECNSHISQTRHPNACEAARAALCAHREAHFEAAYKILFDSQTDFRPGYPLTLLREAKIVSQEAESCIHSSWTELRILQDQELAKKLNVEATPTFFINGHKMEGAGYPVPVWNRIIDTLLAQPQSNTYVTN